MNRFGKLIIGLLVIGVLPAYAQDNKLSSLSKQIMDAKCPDNLCAPFEELKELYLGDNKYAEFIDFLNSVQKKKGCLKRYVDYYSACTRYRQLKNLEETQNWDEYFARGNAYRDQITGGAQRAIGEGATDCLSLRANLLLWKFHKDQEDAFKGEALGSLVSSAQGYADSSGDLALVKEVADTLSSYGEKGKSKELYKIYARGLTASDIKDGALYNTAEDFYKSSNPELAESIYDAYIARVSKAMPKEKLALMLVGIAEKFSYKDKAPADPYYAEKIFKQIDALNVKDALSADLLYLRAQNLEKSKEYVLAKEQYAALLSRYPEYTRADEAEYKIALISAYVARDIKGAKEYFAKLAQKETARAQVISSLYQLGLLSQWEGDPIKAGEYYDKLIEKAKDNYPETLALARERLGEIANQKPLENNLKTFLDVSLKEENKEFDMSKLGLASSAYDVPKGVDVNLSAGTELVQRGCLQVEFQYLWAGDIRGARPSLDQGSFSAKYNEPGTKIIGLTVISPSGILDRGIILLDVD